MEAGFSHDLVKPSGGVFTRRDRIAAIRGYGENAVEAGFSHDLVKPSGEVLTKGDRIAG